MGKIGVKGRAGKGDYGRNPSAGKMWKLPLSWEKTLHCILLPYWLRPIFFLPFRKMQNYVKCLKFPSPMISLYQPLSRKRLTMGLSWVPAPLQMNLLQQAAATRACYCCCVISSSRHSCPGVLCPWWIIKPCTPVFQGVSYISKWLLKAAVGHTKSMLDMKLVPVIVAFVFVTGKFLFSAPGCVGM